jgi:hypothetical protein
MQMRKLTSIHLYLLQNINKLLTNTEDLPHFLTTGTTYLLANGKATTDLF